MYLCFVTVICIDEMLCFQVGPGGQVSRDVDFHSMIMGSIPHRPPVNPLTPPRLVNNWELLTLKSDSEGKFLQKRQELHVTSKQININVNLFTHRVRK